MNRAIAAVIVLACSVTLSDAAPPATAMPCDSISAVLVAERAAILGGSWVDAPEYARLSEIEHLIDHVAAQC